MRLIALSLLDSRLRGDWQQRGQGEISVSLVGPVLPADEPVTFRLPEFAAAVLLCRKAILAIMCAWQLC